MLIYQIIFHFCLKAHFASSVYYVPYIIIQANLEVRNNLDIMDV